MSERIAKRIWIASMVFFIGLAAFGYGMAVGRYQIWPFHLILRTNHVAESLWRFGEFVPEGSRFPAPPEASRETFKIHDPDRLGEGYYAILGKHGADDRYAAWLLDAGGRLLHTWKIEYDELRPDGVAPSAGNPHAFHVLADGSILVAFDSGDVLARVDSCGALKWIKTGIFTHSMSRADDGTFWTWRAEGSHYAQHQYLVNFDPETGRTIREVGLIEDILGRMGPKSAIFGVRPDYPFVHLSEDPARPAAVDFFHPNDVDVLTADKAPVFPMFEPGDLLVSFRANDLVAVLDPDTARIEWWSHGPWLAQHDPDFTDDGMISVYSNNTRRKRSEIIKMDPRTGEFENELFDGPVRFYSASMGKHQYLPNGNVLIVVPDEGRVLEVTPDGDYVMEFNNLSPGSVEYNEHVENAIWLAPDYFAQEAACSVAPEGPATSTRPTTSSTG